MTGENKYHGSCLCGQIHYVVSAELSDFGYCHCGSCRKASGSAFGANAGVERAHFQLFDEHRHLREFESTPGKWRAFCSHCGSPLYAYLQNSAELIRIRLGSLDSKLHKSAKAHTFVAHKAEWEDLQARLPEFAEWADRAVLVQTGSRQT